MLESFPRLSLREGDRRWALAQQLIETLDLAALLVYGSGRGPTLGSCHARLSATGDQQRDGVVQECAVGLVTVRRTGNGSPSPRRRSYDEAP
jgi:hypothetical protein